MTEDIIDIIGCKLVKTCYACPEQYDVYYNGEQIGYLRLRHGCFRAEYPDVGGIEVFSATPKGMGSFCEEERMFFLTEAVKALKIRHFEAVGQKPSYQEYTLEILPNVLVTLNWEQLQVLKSKIDNELLSGPGKG